MKHILTILSLLISSSLFSQVVVKVPQQDISGKVNYSDSLSKYVTPSQLGTKVDTSHHDITNVFAPLYSVNVNDSTHELHAYVSTDTTFSGASDTTLASSLAVKKYAQKVDYVSDETALQNYTGNAKTVIVKDTLKGGTFNYTTAALTPDNAVIYAATGKGSGYWQRVIKANEIESEWFGAVGDGSHNDAPALDSAFKYNGYTVVLRAGKTYKVQSTFHMGSGCKLVGNGATIQRDTVSININVLSAVPKDSSGTTIVTVDSTNTTEFAKLKVGIQLMFVNRQGDTRRLDAAYKVITAINGATITLTGGNTVDSVWSANTAALVNVYPIILASGDNIQISGVNIDGARKYYTNHMVYWEAGTTINCGSTKNILIRDCYITNSLCDGIMGGGLNGSVVHNRIYWSGNGAVHLSGSNGCVIDGNFFFDTNSNQFSGHNEASIIFSNSIWDAKITNNVIDVCARGIGAINSTDNSDILISNNTIRRYLDRGIDIYSPVGNTIKNVSIVGNHIYGAVDITALQLPYLPTPIQTVTYPTTSAIKFLSDGTLENISITGNVIENASLELSGCKKLNVTGNTIMEINATLPAGSPANLVTLTGSTGVFAANTIVETGTSLRSVVLYSSMKDMVISGNDITTDKMVVEVNSSNSIFQNNIVTGNVRIANSCSLINNDITGTLYVGWLSNADNNLYVAMNKVSASIQIATNDTSLTLKNNITPTITGTGVNTLRIGNIVNGVNEDNRTGSGAPSSTPTAIGQKFTDFTNKKIYQSTGTSSSADWTLVN
jgi:hypothetical protein